MESRLTLASTKLRNREASFAWCSRRNFRIAGGQLGYVLYWRRSSGQHDYRTPFLLQWPLSSFNPRACTSIRYFRHPPWIFPSWKIDGSDHKTRMCLRSQTTEQNPTGCLRSSTSFRALTSWRKSSPLHGWAGWVDRSHTARTDCLTMRPLKRVISCCSVRHLPTVKGTLWNYLLQTRWPTNQWTCLGELDNALCSVVCYPLMRGILPSNEENGSSGRMQN